MKRSGNKKAGLRVLRTASYVEVSESQGTRKAWSAAVVATSNAGHQPADLTEFVALGEHLGQALGSAALEALGVPPGESFSYGKGAIVGLGCEIEQAAAILHPRMGKPLRDLLGRGKAIIPSTVKRGGPGTVLDVPLHGADDEWDFALLDSIEVCVPSAPGFGELVVAIALGFGGRANSRIGSPEED